MEMREESIGSRRSTVWQPSPFPADEGDGELCGGVVPQIAEVFERFAVEPLGFVDGQGPGVRCLTVKARA
ncbi:hypothetical protein [Streptomyces sp. 8N616]|uniref:hypothetical protein n=1 Tax=Streptomyces sp. 8N616 TaxID=3457414 RepID=UPI003FD21C6B